MNMAKDYSNGGAHVKSYYAASANPSPERPPLLGEADYQICIVGAGYSGLSAALELAEKGYKVAILEGAKIGWGASGRNGGQIVNGLNASLQKIGRVYGHDAAQFVAGVVQEGGEIIRERVKKYHISCDLKDHNIFAAFTNAHMKDLEERVQLWASYGIRNQEILSKTDMRDYVGTDAYNGGVIDRSGGHMHPLNLALGEAAAFESLGGVIYEHSPVIHVDYQVQRPIVHTANGNITCDKVLLCGNAYLGAVVPALTARVMPVSTQIMATEPLNADLAHRLLPTDSCIEDVRYILDYYRLSADKRLLFGGGTVYGGSDPKDIKAKLYPNMLKIFPELKGVNIEYAWSGNFALSFSRVPQLGKLSENCYFAHGYSGHGVTGSHLFGRILAEAVHQDFSRFDVFAKMKYVPFPGGRALRVPYSVLGSWWYSLRDILGV